MKFQTCKRDTICFSSQSLFFDRKKSVEFLKNERKKEKKKSKSLFLIERVVESGFIYFFLEKYHTPLKDIYNRKANNYPKASHALKKQGKFQSSFSSES